MRGLIISHKRVFCNRDINRPSLGSQKPFWLGCTLSSHIAVTKWFCQLVLGIWTNSTLATVFQGRSLDLAFTTPPTLSGLILDPLIYCILRVGGKALWLNVVFHTTAVYLLRQQMIWPVTEAFSFIVHMWCDEIHLIDQMKQAHTHISSCTCSH